MCGISGILDFGTSASLDLAQQVDAMSFTLRSRGPDDSGRWVDESSRVALGHRRLSVIDISASGHQPMLSGCGRYVIVFNGEIYNFLNLRKELEDLGYTFKSQSDTEVLVNCVQKWGIVKAIQKCNGMFAIALWDKQERTLHLGRDRLGEKPLYYGWVNNTLLFASELKAFHAFDGFQPRINRSALSQYFQYKYIPYPFSIFENVYKLPPGSLLKISNTDINSPGKPIAYWKLFDIATQGLANPYTESEADISLEFERLFSNTVQKRMVADVPLGAFLSGGIDSSSVVAMMKAKSSQEVKTFTIGFNEFDYNEASHAREVANYLQTSHTELYVSPQQAMDVIPSLPCIYDEPFSDCSQIPTYLVAKMAREKVTVALSGDGGDELFAGYWRHFMAERLWKRIQPLPGCMNHALAKLIMSISPMNWDKGRAMLDSFLPETSRSFPIGDRLYKLADMLDALDEPDLYQGFVTDWQRNACPVMKDDDFTFEQKKFSEFRKSGGLSETMMYLDAMNYLPGDILTKVDRATMAVSLEARVPFLDPDIIEFAWRVPMHMKVRNGKGKWLLRDVLSRHLPEKLYDRPKTGFGVPIDSWLRGPLRDWAEELLSPGKIQEQGFLDSAFIQNRWKEHLSGKRNWQYQLWSVLMFQAWYQYWLDR